MSKPKLRAVTSLHGLIEHMYFGDGLRGQDALEHFSDQVLLCVLNKAKAGDADAIRWLEEKNLITLSHD